MLREKEIKEIIGGHQPQCRYKPQNLNREFKWERIMTYQASHEWMCTPRHELYSLVM